MMKDIFLTHAYFISLFGSNSNRLIRHSVLISITNDM